MGFIVINVWCLTIIRAIPVQFEKELINTEGKFENCSFKYDKEPKYEKYISDNLIGEDIVLDVVSIPGKLKIRSINNYEYQKLVSKFYYGRRMFITIDEPEDEIKNDKQPSDKKTES